MICGVALAIVAAGVGFIMGTSRSTGSSSLLLRHPLSSSSPEDDLLQRDHHDGRALKHHHRNYELPSHTVSKMDMIPATHTYNNMHSIDGKSGKSGRRPWGKSGKSGAASGSSMKWPSHYDDDCLSGKSGKSGEGKSGKSGYYSEGKSGKSGRIRPWGKSGKSGGDWTASPSITHRMLKKKKKKKGPWGGKSGKSGAASTHKKYHLFAVSLFCCLLFVATNDMYIYYLQS